MKTGIGRQLDPNRRSKSVEDFERSLRHKIIGQDPAIESVIDIFQMFSAGLNPPRRPVGTLLFLGPTGTGKTRVVEAVAESLFGDSGALIKVDCGEFQHSHEIAKLIGSPPGYLGHRETHPVLTQEAINLHHTESLKLTFLLFDEIEKASDALWQLLLGILDKGTLTLGDNRRVDLSSCVIVMTSNIGAAEMGAMVSGGLGFSTPNTTSNDELEAKIQRTALDAARRKFSPEFINRIDKSVVFKTLRQGHLEQILELELEAVQDRILRASDIQFMLSVTDDVKAHLLKDGTDHKYGARHLKRSIERNLVFPLANLVATAQIHIGDSIKASSDVEGEYVFTVESENSFMPMLLAKYANLGGQALAREVPEMVSEESPSIKKAKKSLKEAEDKLAEAKKRKRELEILMNPEEEKNDPA